MIKNGKKQTKKETKQNKQTNKQKQQTKPNQTNQPNKKVIFSKEVRKVMEIMKRLSLSFTLLLTVLLFTRTVQDKTSTTLQVIQRYSIRKFITLYLWIIHNIFAKDGAGHNLVRRMVTLLKSYFQSQRQITSVLFYFCSFLEARTRTEKNTQ